MKGSILVTDSLFVGPSHVADLEKAGYEVHRLDEPRATEAQLIQVINGKVGYILGGIESVTAPVIAAADALEVISFTGSGYSEFIPAHGLATEKGIAITAARGGNAISVAQFTLAQILAAARQIPLLTQPGGKSFLISREFSGLTVGVIGLGAIGKEVARLCTALGFRVLGHGRRSSDAYSAECEAADLDQLLRDSDIVTLHVSKEHGHHVLGSSEIDLLRPGAAVINCAFPEAVEADPLFARIAAGEVRAIFDAPPASVPQDLPVGGLMASNAQTAFNTAEGNTRVSDMVVRSLLNVLESGHDDYVVNPEFRSGRTGR